MSTNPFFDSFYDLCRAHGTSPNAVGKELGLSSGSITAWKQGAVPRASTALRLAEYFGVSLNRIMGKEADPPRPTPVGISDEALKFALFGGDGPVSDEMLSEVRRFAQFLKSQQ